MTVTKALFGVSHPGCLASNFTDGRAINGSKRTAKTCELRTFETRVLLRCGSKLQLRFIGSGRRDQDLAKDVIHRPGRRLESHSGIPFLVPSGSFHDEASWRLDRRGSAKTQSAYPRLRSSRHREADPFGGRVAAGVKQDVRSAQCSQWWYGEGAVAGSHGPVMAQYRPELWNDADLAFPSVTTATGVDL